MSVQSSYRFTVATGSSVKFEVVSFKLFERLSKPFKLEMQLVSDRPDVDFSEVLDEGVTLFFHHGDEVVRHVNGVVTSFKMRKSGFKKTAWEIVVEPIWSRLELRQNSRIFQKKTVPAIIEEIFKENRLNFFKIEAVAEHLPREFCTQYRETDKAFIERIASEEGISFTFTHDADKHTLIMEDMAQRYPDIAGDKTVTYNPNPSGDRPEPAAWQFDYLEEVATSKHVMRDYTFTNPRYQQEHAQDARGADNQNKHYETYDFPGRYKEDAAGRPFNQYRLEQLRRETKRALVESDDLRLIAGHHFTLESHPVDSLNQDWLIVEVIHEGTQSQAMHDEGVSQAKDGQEQGSFYSNQAVVIPWAHPWRPDTMHKPRVDGPQIGRITGPSGEEIYTDKWGRVKVHFYWDRYSKQDDTSSTWIRVVQNWAGAQFGHMAIPRVGQEVVVSFLEGDPDQPIVTGRTYDALNLPPYELPANKTRMTIKSKSHKGNGFNELRFEDELGQEEVFIHAEKDQNNVVKNNETTKVGVDRTENIGNNEDITIGNNRTEKVVKNESVNIGKNRSVTIGKNKTETIGMNKAETIAIAKALTIGAGYQVSVGASKNESVGLTSTEQVGMLKHSIVGQRYELQVGESSLILNADGTIMLKGKKIEINGEELVDILGKLVQVN